MVLSEKDAFKAIVKTTYILQKKKHKATPKIIRDYAAARFAGLTPKLIEQVPKFLKRGVSLGLLKKVKKSYRIDSYIVKRDKKLQPTGQNEKEKLFLKQLSEYNKMMDKCKNSDSNSMPNLLIIT